MFIFYYIGKFIGDMIKLAIILILVLLYVSYYGNNSDDLSLNVEPVYTEKHKPSGLIIPKHDPRVYREIQ
jgi:hypothetical protein